MSNRRDFIKKSLAGTAIYSVTYPFFGMGLEQVPTEFSLSRLKELSNQDDWNSIKSQFIYKGGNLYFNTASLGASPRIVVDSICKSLIDLEEKGRDGRWLFDECREKLANMLLASTEEIAISRNATEGMNIVANSLPLKEGDEILLSKHEHIGGSAPWISLQKTKGVVVKTVDLNLNGKDNLQMIEEAISSTTRVISISHLLCTTGMVLPVKEIVEMCRSKGVYTCIDGAQALGCIEINLKEINPDFYVASGHKWLFGPKGTGILFINKSVIEDCTPVFSGAYTDEEFNLNKRQLSYRKVAEREEYGTRNASIIQGLSAAIDFHESLGTLNILKRGRFLVSRFLNDISKHDAIEILTPREVEFSASIITFRFKERNNKHIVELLRSDYQLVIRHIYENELDAIRVSFSIQNSEEEVDQLLLAIQNVYLEHE